MSKLYVDEIQPKTTNGKVSFTDIEAIAFRVGMATSPAVSTDFVVKFDTVKQDTGSNYSTSTGEFTAPVSGYYHFGHAMLLESVASSDDSIIVRYRLNGNSGDSNTWLFNRTDGSAANGTVGTGGYLHVLGNALMYMNKGDTIDIRVDSSGSITVHGNSNASYSQWYGYFVGK